MAFMRVMVVGVCALLFGCGDDVMNVYVVGNGGSGGAAASVGVGGAGGAAVTSASSAVASSSSVASTSASAGGAGGAGGYSAVGGSGSGGEVEPPETPHCWPKTNTTCAELHPDKPNMFNCDTPFDQPDTCDLHTAVTQYVTWCCAERCLPQSGVDAAYYCGDGFSLVLYCHGLDTPDPNCKPLPPGDTGTLSFWCCP